MSKPLKVYIAGKVSKESHFGEHYWRDEFVAELEAISGRKLINLDPTKSNLPQGNPEIIFGGDAYMIAQCDVLIVYLSDDISVGGSQEILVGKYFKKPVIGLAPQGGKFNGLTREFFGETIKNYQDPFVFTTCDFVCEDEQAVGEALKTIESIKPKTIDIIGDLKELFIREHLENNPYLKNLAS